MELEIKCLKVGVRLQHATKRHARDLARIMRNDDKLEILASGGFLPETATRASINRSAEAWAAYAGEDLLAVFGVVRFPSGWDSPWALSSNFVAKYPLTYWRGSRVVVGDLRERYPKMVQMVHARYVGALRWCERLGFKVGEPTRFGVANTLFCRVSMETPKLIREVG